MNLTQSTFRSFLAAMLLVTLAVFGFAGTSRAQAAPPAQSAGSAQAAAPAPPPSFCGNQPLCYEAPNFAATVTDFRTSVQGGYRIIDTVIRFQNKTPNPVILGYVVNSGTAMDDRGNRYIVYGANGYRGIGQVYGNNFDPRFTLSPGGYGDAQFELMWAPGQQIYGFTFDLSMSVDEINTVEGNQHTLGGEFPLIFKGLSNGASSNGASGGGAAGVPMTAMTPAGGAASGQPAAASAAQPGCAANGIAGTATSVASATGSASAQNAAGAANSKVSSATNAISNLSSIFGHKKKPAAAAPSAAPCPQAATAAPTPAPTAASAASAAAQTMSSGAAPAPASSPAGSPATVTSVSAKTTAAPSPASAAANKPTATTKKPAATPKKPVTPTTPNKPSQK